MEEHCFTRRRLVVRFHHALILIWNGEDKFLVIDSLLTITNELTVTFFDPHHNMKW